MLRRRRVGGRGATPAHWGLAIAMTVAATGCASALTEGESQFKKGRYPEAKETFARLSQESRTWDDARRAEYALYRGLTSGALGDRAQASVWLLEAKTIEDTHPGSLSADDLARLRLGLDSVSSTQAPPP